MPLRDDTQLASSLTVRLPLLFVNGKAADDGDQAVRAVEQHDSGGRVLVVYDEMVIGEILDGVLSTAGYDVVCAVGGREALRLADDQAFDLVLLDINMPGIDGWEVLAELQQTQADLPVGMERGARRLIQKPFDSSALLLSVGEDIRAR